MDSIGIKPTITELLRRIHLNTKKNDVNNKKNWYKVGKKLLSGEKFKWHDESKVGARRTYRFYSVNKGVWNGPTPRQLAKMRKSKFEELLSRRLEEERQILEFLEALNVPNEEEDPVANVTLLQSPEPPSEEDVFTLNEDLDLDLNW